MGYHLRIKICGVTTPADACDAAQLGADAVGLNFYPPSPRRVDAAAAVRILAELPAFVEPIALFVEEPLSRIAERLEALPRVRTVQRHGRHGEPEDGARFRVLPAFAVRDADSLDEVRRYVQRSRALGRLPPAVLADAHVPGLHGGTGRTAPWDLLAGFEMGAPLILAGGLTPDNVAEAVRVVRPYAVDVASGVESAPGRKDVEKMRRFIQNAREAAARL
jgi:phosphoribosylanthranilate isomerase